MFRNKFRNIVLSQEANFASATNVSRVSQTKKHLFAQHCFLVYGSLEGFKLQTEDSSELKLQNEGKEY